MTTSEGEAKPAELTSGDAQEAAPLSGSVTAPPANARQLEAEIRRTREQLGETVQELVARADVKSRALAKAAELSGKYKTAVAQARWLPLAAAAGTVIIGCLVVWQWRARAGGARR